MLIIWYNTGVCAIPIEQTVQYRQQCNRREHKQCNRIEGVAGSSSYQAQPLTRFPHLNCRRGAQKGEGNHDDDYHHPIPDLIDQIMVLALPGCTRLYLILPRYDLPYHRLPLNGLNVDGLGWDGNLCKLLFYEHRSVVLIKIEAHLKKHKPTW